MHELQIILEDIRNQLTIVKGFTQLKRCEHSLCEEMLVNPINNVDRLTEEALKILEITKCRF